MTNLTLSDLLNVAYTDGVDQALTEFGLPTSAAEPLNTWSQAQEHVLALEDQAQQAAGIADQIAEQLQPLFDSAMEAA